VGLLARCQTNEGHGFEKSDALKQRDERGRGGKGYERDWEQGIATYVRGGAREFLAGTSSLRGSVLALKVRIEGFIAGRRKENINRE